MDWSNCKGNLPRESSILDLLFTNKRGLVKSHQTIPGISNHHMIVVDSTSRLTWTASRLGGSTKVPEQTGRRHEKTQESLLENIDIPVLRWYKYIRGKTLFTVAEPRLNENSETKEQAVLQNQDYLIAWRLEKV